MTLAVGIGIIVCIAFAVLYVYSDIPSESAFFALFLFLILFVYTGYHVVNELDYMDCDNVKIYDSVVIKKDIIVNGTSVSYHQNSQFTFAAIIAPVHVRHHASVRYILYCQNPIDTSGEDVRFSVDKQVYGSTQVGQSCKMKVYMKGNTVVKARLLGNKGEVGSLY